MLRTLLPIFTVVTMLLLYPATPGHANKTPDEAKAFLERAIAHIHDVGREAAFKDFSTPGGEFHDGELYVFCFAADGTTLAHGGNPAFVGKDLSHIKNPDGKYGNAEIIRTGLEQGSGWVDVRWQNPATKKIEGKGVYVVRLDANSVCASGYYKG